MDERVAQKLVLFWKQYLEIRGWRQSDLVKRSGISKHTVSKWVSGKQAVSLRDMNILIKKRLLQTVEFAKLFHLTLEDNGFTKESYLYMRAACATASHEVVPTDTTPRRIGSPSSVKANTNRPIIAVRPITGSATAFYTNIEQMLGVHAQAYGYHVESQPVPDTQKKLSLHSYRPDLKKAGGIVAIGCDVAQTTWLDEIIDHGSDGLGIPIVLIHDEIAEHKLFGKGRVSALWEDLSALEELVVHLIDDHECTGLRVISNDPSVRKYRALKVNRIIEVAKAKGVEINRQRHVFFTSNDISEQGDLFAHLYIVDDPDADAVICLSDEVALGVMRRLEQSNVLVTGYDDIPTAEHHGITSISQDRSARAKWAIDEIYAASTREAGDYPVLECMPSTLKLRASCGCSADTAP